MWWCMCVSHATWVHDGIGLMYITKMIGNTYFTLWTGCMQHGCMTA